MDIKSLLATGASLVAGAENLAKVTHAGDIASILVPGAGPAIKVVEGAIDFVTNLKTSIETGKVIADAQDKAAVDQMLVDLEAHSDKIHAQVQALT